MDEDEGSPLEILEDDIINHVVARVEPPPVWYADTTSDSEASSLVEQEETTKAEVGFQGIITRAHVGLGHVVSDGDLIVSTYNVADDTESSTIVKDYDILTEAELVKHKHDVRKVKAKELDTSSVGELRENAPTGG